MLFVVVWGDGYVQNLRAVVTLQALMLDPPLTLSLITFSLCPHLQNLLLLPVSHLQDDGRGERAI